MEKPTYHHGDLRAALLDAAEEDLRNDPNCALSVRSLAGKIGVSATAPHAHFRTKSDLLAGIAARGFVRLRDDLAKVSLDGQNTQATLARLAECYLTFAQENSGLYRLMFTTGVSLDENAELRQASRAAYDVLRDFVRGAFPGRSTDMTNQTALMAWAMVHGLGSLLNEGRIAPDIAADRSPAVFADSTAALLMRAEAHEVNGGDDDS